MTAKTQPTACSDKNNSPEVPALGGRRVEDHLRLRELELQTNFQIQTLTESLNLLKTDFISWRESLNEEMKKVKQEMDSVKNRTTVLIVLALTSLGADALPGILARIALGG